MVLVAVNGRSVLGRGAYVDLSMTEAVVSLVAPEMARETSVGQAPNLTALPHYGLFECADGRWASLAIVHEDHFWDRFCDAAGLADLVGLGFDERLGRRDVIRRRLCDTIRSLPSAKWERRMADADVPFATVATLDEAIDNAQFRVRDIFVDVGSHRFVAQPARFSTGPIAPESGPPALGEHTKSILEELNVV